MHLALENRKSGYDAFIGEWVLDGRQFDGPFGPAAVLSARETFTWLTGGAFIVHRIDGRLGDAPLGCVEIIGDGFAHAYYNDGTERAWSLKQNDKVWTIMGPSGRYLVRCTMVFTEGGRTRTAKWEYAEHDKWTVFWETVARKTSRRD